MFAGSSREKLRKSCLPTSATAARRMRAAYETEKTTLRLVDAYARMEARQGRRDEALRAYRAFDEALPRHPLIVDAMRRVEADQPIEPLVRSAVAELAPLARFVCVA